MDLLILSGVIAYSSASIGTAAALANDPRTIKKGEMFFFGLAFMPITLTMLAFNKLTRYLLD